LKQKTSSGRKRKAKPPERPLSAERAAFAARMRAGFQDIGHFIFEFSQLEFTIRAVLSSALKLPDGYFDIVTSGYDFAMLCNVTRAVALKQRPDHEPAIEKLFNDCLKLNDERVRVAHGKDVRGRGSCCPTRWAAQPAAKILLRESRRARSLSR
jgi:hypothetical protein